MRVKKREANRKKIDSEASKRKVAKWKSPIYDEKVLFKKIQKTESMYCKKNKKTLLTAEVQINN